MVWIISFSTAKAKKDQATRLVKQTIDVIRSKVNDEAYVKQSHISVANSAKKAATSPIIWSHILARGVLYDDIQPLQLTDPMQWYGLATASDIKKNLDENFDTLLRADFDPQ